MKSNKKYQEHKVEAKWDPISKSFLVSKEDYEDWDEISDAAFECLFLPSCDETLKQKATKILSNWYQKEKLNCLNRTEFVDIVKDTLRNKILSCKVAEDRNAIWQVIDDNKLNFEYKLDESLKDDFDLRWDEEFGQYMDGIQVMKAEDAINLLKRMEEFE